MYFKASGRAAIVTIAAGFLALHAAPSLACDTSDCQRIVLAQNADPQAQPDAAATAEPATESTKATKQSRQAHKSSRPDKTSKTSASSKKSSADKASQQSNNQPANPQPAVSPTVANANAQMTSPAATGTPDDQPKPVATIPVDGTQPLTTNAAQNAPPAVAADPAPAMDNDTNVVASDQLNELDRAAADDKAAPKVLHPVSQTQQQASTGNDPWSQTSLIGKIFIAFGGVLTLASAARMFIA